MPEQKHKNTGQFQILRRFQSLIFPGDKDLLGFYLTTTKTTTEKESAN